MSNKNEWMTMLDGCDFVMACEDVSRSLTMLREEGEEKGGSYYISPQFASALKAFYSEPAFESAVVLLEVVPAFLPMFEFNSPKNPLFAYSPNMLRRNDVDET